MGRDSPRGEIRLRFEMKRFKSVFCAVFRHSVITSSCFGYNHCGRCETLLGDSLAGAYSPACNLTCGCQKCQDAYPQLGFVDKFLVPKPEWLGWTPEAWKADRERQRKEAFQIMRKATEEMRAAQGA